MVARKITNGPIVELTEKIDKLCTHYQIETVRDSVLNILTWYCGDLQMTEGVNVNILIDEICNSLKHSTKLYIQANTQ